MGVSGDTLSKCWRNSHTIMTNGKSIAYDAKSRCLANVSKCLDRQCLQRDRTNRRVLSGCASHLLKLASVICQPAWRSVVFSQCANQTNSRYSPRLRNQKRDVERITLQVREQLQSSRGVVSCLCCSKLVTLTNLGTLVDVNPTCRGSPNVWWRRPTTPGSSSQLLHIKLQTGLCVDQHNI